MFSLSESSRDWNESYEHPARLGFEIILGYLPDSHEDDGDPSCYLEVWDGDDLIDLFFGSRADVRDRALAWFGDGGVRPVESGPYDVEIRTQSQMSWWSEHCDPEPGR